MKHKIACDSAQDAGVSNDACSLPTGADRVSLEQGKQPRRSMQAELNLNGVTPEPRQMRIDDRSALRHRLRTGLSFQ